MANRNKYWVVWNADEEVWKVKKEGNDKALRVFDTKQPAIDYGVEVAKNNRPSQLFIQNQDGTISDERTYDNDPRDIPG